MDRESSTQLLLKLMALADRMEQRDARVIQQLAQHATGLQQSAHSLETAGQGFARNALDAIRAQGRDAVQAGVEQAVSHCNRQLADAARQAQRTAGDVADSATALRRQRSLWLWAAPLALVVGAVLAAGGSTYLVWKNARELERADFGQDILQATRSGAITSCGDTLCVRVGSAPARTGAHGEYLLIAE